MSATVAAYILVTTITLTTNTLQSTPKKCADAATYQTSDLQRTGLAFQYPGAIINIETYCVPITVAPATPAKKERK